jgi:hypothetical protein
MDFEYSQKTQRLRGVVQRFIDDDVAPCDAEWHAKAHAGVFPLAVIDSIEQSSKGAGLWNFFLPSLRDNQPGQTNLEYAPLAEIMGRTYVGDPLAAQKLKARLMARSGVEVSGQAVSERFASIGRTCRC